MNTILMVYVKDAYKEFILPAIDNADYVITLHKEIFYLEQDEEIYMEIIDQKWRFVESPDYSIKKKDESYFGKIIQNGDVLELVKNHSQNISILVLQSRQSFQVFKKYDITKVSEITIGKEETNVIQYDFQNLMSRKHGRIFRKGEKFFIEDTSANGIFLNSIRIQEQEMLQFGDCINIFGLHVIYLGDILGVCRIGGELEVKEQLSPYYRNEKKAKRIKKIKTNKTYFHRSPRNIPPLYRGKIEIKRICKKEPINTPYINIIIGIEMIMALCVLMGGSLVLIGCFQEKGEIYQIIGMIIVIISAVTGTLWITKKMFQFRKKTLEMEHQWKSDYEAYLIGQEEFIKKMYQRNEKILNEMYPSAKKCCAYNRETPALWNRNFKHDDFLFVRLGKGNVPFQGTIEIPKEKMELGYFTQRAEELLTRYQTLQNVPVGINLLQNRLFGVVGGQNKRGGIEVLHSIIVQIVANHCYTDVKIVVAYDERSQQDRKDWMFVKWLPHIWSEDKKTRYLAANKKQASDIFYELTNIFRLRDEEGKIEVKIPHYVVFLSNPQLLEGEPLEKYIYNCKEEYGLTTFVLEEKYKELPNSCEYIIEKREEYAGIYHVVEENKSTGKIIFDAVETVDLELFARRLAQIEINETEGKGEVPNSLDFFEMYGVSKIDDLHVLDRWKKNRTYETMSVLIGKKAGGSNCYLDIHEKYHGPHGLIAGTTGSGKSETLQTYILSLALNFSPQDVAFFIIDFKGGGMANLFYGLPHLAGQISNLSGNQIHRAMVSIQSENRRRQRIFNEYGVNHINLYTRLLKNKEADIAIPHLFIIIDEFAELKREHPEFMKEFISVAQVGRSLGVHLILATQKPSGVVDDNIWSNTKFKLCLRVQDKQDSNDMLHKSDAAYITQAGRCYLQVGNNEVYELLQSGWSGAGYKEGIENYSDIATMVTVNGKPAIVGNHKRQKSKEEKTQLEVTVSYLNNLAKKHYYTESFPLWMPVLPEKLYLEEIEEYKKDKFHEGKWRKNLTPWGLQAIVGKCDDLINQSQMPLVMDFTQKGHYAVCGTVVSGKSTFLQTVLFSLINHCTPDEINIYGMDFSSQMLGSLEPAPHIGGIMFEEEIEKIEKFFNLIKKMLEERKKKLKGGNYKQYVQVNGITMPAILLVIDNFSNFREKTEDKYEGILNTLSRDGAAYGIYLLISSSGFGMAEIPYRMGDNIRNVICLEMGDKYKYIEALHSTEINILPEVSVKGRGLAMVNGIPLEFQTALSLEAEDDYQRGENIKQICRQMKKAWSGKGARRIPEIPEKPVFSEFNQLEEYEKMLEKRKYIPLGYQMEDASLYSVDISKTYCYLITGKSRTGKKNVLKVLLQGAMRTEADICVFDEKRKKQDNLEYSQTNYWEKLCRAKNNLTNKKGTIDYVNSEAGIFQYWKNMIPVFAERSRKKQAYIESGLTDEEIFEKMQQEKPIYIFITDLAVFLQYVYEPKEETGDMSGFMENISKKGRLHGIYFFAVVREESVGKIISYPSYRNFAEDKGGIHMGGNLAVQRRFSFENIPYAEQNKVKKPGVGFTPSKEDESKADIIIIPLVKGEAEGP